MKRIKTFPFIFLILIVGVLQGCKKEDYSPDEKTPPAKLLVKRIISKFEWVEKPVNNRTEELILEYNASNQLVKTTKHVTDFPREALVLADGEYDTYEYEGDKLVKHNLYRRMGRDPENPVELSQYDEYAYNTDGQISEITVFHYRQLPPDGHLGFRASEKYKYIYNENKQLAEVKTYVLIYFNQQLDSERPQFHTLFRYTPEGNLSKSYFNWIGGVNGGTFPLNERHYSGYDDKMNPAYSASFLPSDLLSFSLSVNNPAQINEIGYLDGLPRTDVGVNQKYEWKYRDDGYPSSVAATILKKTYITISPDGSLYIETENGTVRTTFEYFKKNK